MIFHNNTALKYNLNITSFVLATMLSILNVYSALIEKPILKWLKRSTNRERELMSERLLLKSEQIQISMIDSFAKYSKLQRKINAIDEELKEINGNKSSFFMEIGFTYGVKLVLGLFVFILSIYYRYTPVFCIGENVDFTPFTQLICYPNRSNCVSFHFWVICCTYVVRLIKIM